jgi:hypothetical protein
MLLEAMLLNFLQFVITWQTYKFMTWEQLQFHYQNAVNMVNNTRYEVLTVVNTEIMVF